MITALIESIKLFVAHIKSIINTLILAIDSKIPSFSATQIRTYTGSTLKTIYLNEGSKSGIFDYDSTDTTTADDGAMVLVNGTKRYKRRITDKIYSEWWGAVADGVVDCTSAIQNAITYLKANNSYYHVDNGVPRGGGRLTFKQGIYKIASTINLANINGTIFEGAGKENTTLLYTGTTKMFECQQLLYNKFIDLQFAAGSLVIDSLSHKTIQYYDYTSTAIGFNWEIDIGGDRFNTFSNCKVYGGFDKFMYLGGQYYSFRTYFQ